MNQTQKNDALRLLPGLDTLIPYQKNFKEIVHILETSSTNKLQEIEEYQKGINQFLNLWPQIIRNHIQAVRSERCLESDKKAQTHSPQSQIQRTKPKIKAQSHLKSSTSPPSVNCPRSDLADEIFLIESKMKEKRSQKLASLFNSKLVRNSQNSLIFTHFINVSMSAVFKSKTVKFRVLMCKHCDFFHRAEHQLCGKSEVLENHFKVCHPSVPYKLRACVNYCTLPDAYEKLTSKTQILGNKYYKCNCQIKAFQNSKQYEQHIRSTHNNQIPPYSSHIHNQNGDLVANPNFNQHCVIEDMINHQTYYCGECNVAFERRPQIFYFHVLNYHQGKTNHPLTSHHLKQNHAAIVESRSEPTATSKLPPHDPKTKHKPIMTERNKQGTLTKIQKQEVEPKVKLVYQKILQFSVKLKFPPARTGKVKLTSQNESENFEKAETFPEEQKIKEIIKKYKGPYICSFCNTDFQSYDKIAEHFETASTFTSHLRQQKNWMRVRIKKVKEKQEYFYYLPISEEFQDVQFLVPSISQKTLNYYRMNYLEFITHAIEINKNYNSYLWFHYSEHAPSNFNQTHKRNANKKNRRNAESFDEEYE